VTQDPDGLRSRLSRAELELATINVSRDSLRRESGAQSRRGWRPSRHQMHAFWWPPAATSAKASTTPDWTRCSSRCRSPGGERSPSMPAVSIGDGVRSGG
jgi:hypothetical protein